MVDKISVASASNGAIIVIEKLDIPHKQRRLVYYRLTNTFLRTEKPCWDCAYKVLFK